MNIMSRKKVIQNEKLRENQDLIIYVYICLGSVNCQNWLHVVGMWART